MVNAVRPVLCFQTYGMLDVVHRAAFAFMLLDPVAGIDLQTFHRRPALHRPSVRL